MELQCDSFLTIENKLPKNAHHIEQTLGTRVLSPIEDVGASSALGSSVPVGGSRHERHRNPGPGARPKCASVTCNWSILRGERLLSCDVSA